VTIAGSDIHGKIQDAVRRQESAERALSDRLYDCEQRIATLVEEREKHFTRLARRALPELSAESVRNTLHEVQSDVEKIYLERQARRQALEKEMIEAADRRAAQDARLAELDGRRTAKAQEIAALKARVTEELRGRTDYPPLRTALAAAIAEVQRVESLQASFLPLAGQNVEAYRANPIFGYLLRRKYGDWSYRANFLTRRLDLWAARKVDFVRQKAAYDVLHGGPTLIAGAIEQRRRVMADHEGKVKTIEREVAGRHGLLRALEESKVLDHQRVAYLEEVTRAQNDWNRKCEERTDLDSTKGSHHVRALERLKTFLKGQEIRALMARVDAEDAPTITRISTIDAEIRILKNDSRGIQHEQATRARRLRELQEVESHFVSRNYDGYGTRFNSGFDFDPYLAGCVAGSYSAMDLCSELDRHRYVEPEPSYSSSSDSMFSSSSFGSSSSFDSSSSSSFGSSSSSSSDSGGGGFSTGGGF
jgi:hypothetical protein